MQAIASSNNSSKRDVELDFIRGIAILLVLDFHSPRSILLAPALWLGFSNFGWCGVDIFFVLSGFLVGGLLVREWDLYGHVDCKRFLIRRGFKIWPQYYMFLLIILATGHRGIAQLWGNLFNVQNYTGGIAHTWSLAVEEHAYLLLIALFATASRIHLATKHLMYIVSGICLLVLLCRFLLALHGVDTFPRTDTRVDGILYGLLLAILYHTYPHVYAKLQHMTWLWAALIAAALLVFRYVTMSRWWTAPLNWLFADALGVSMLLLLYRRRNRQRSVAYRLVAWIGLYSYGIYLWHISFMASVFTLAHKLPRAWSVALELSAPLLLGVGVGVVTTKVVEQPALMLRDRLFPKRITSPTTQ